MASLTSFILLTIIYQFELIFCQDLKSIFHTPNRRNYDDLEIIERSNFGDGSTQSTSSNSEFGPPKSFANAQVMLRFGGDYGNVKCRCGENCNCKNCPYYHPVPSPLPCCCAPPICYSQPPIRPLHVLPHHFYQPPHVITPPLTPPNYAFIAYSKPIQTCSIRKFIQPNLYQPTNLIPSLPSYDIEPRLSFPSSVVTLENEKIKSLNEDSQVSTTQNENFVNEKTEGNCGCDNHPEILDPIELTDNSINLESSPKQVISNSLESTKTFSYQPKVSQISPNILQNSLVSYNHPKLLKTKYLLCYPIFESPKQSTSVNTQSGYSVSEGSASYSDPEKTIIYQKPTEIEITPPQTTIFKKNIEIPNPRSKFVPLSHSDDYECCSCNRYVGELNEFEKA